MFAHLSFLKRWWFWALLVCALLTLWYTRDRLAWDERQMGYALQNQVTTEYWNAQQRLIAEREAAYRADQYGAATPEETLRLFVEALERKDYVLASKYFVVEEQADRQRDLVALTTDDMAFYLRVLKFTHKTDIFSNGKEANINFYSNDEQVHFEHLILNPFTQKWKLTDN